MDPLHEVLQALVDLGAGQTWDVALALLVASTVSMAVLQIFKEMTPLRRVTQERWVIAWFKKNEPEFTTAWTGSSEQGNRPGLRDPDQLSSDLVELATGGDKEALYELPPEDMYEQMSAAAVIVLDEPHRYPSLLYALASGADVPDLITVENMQPTGGSTTLYFDARNRCSRRIQRNLEGMRISIAYRWRRWLQGTALVLTVLVLEFALAMHGAKSESEYVWAAVLGLVGGYLAPIMRDLVAALQKLREPV
jgi:hypothetical protein